MKLNIYYNLIIFFYLFELKSNKYNFSQQKQQLFTTTVLENKIILKNDLNCFFENSNYRHVYNSLYLKKTILKKIYAHLSDKSYFKNRLVYYSLKENKKFLNLEQHKNIKNIQIIRFLDENNKTIYSYNNLDIKPKISSLIIDTSLIKSKKMGYYKKLRADKKLTKQLKESGLTNIIPKLTYYQKLLIIKNK